MELNREMIERFFVLEYALEDEYYDEFVGFNIENDFIIIEYINMFGKQNELKISKDEILKFKNFD